MRYCVSSHKGLQGAGPQEGEDFVRERQQPVDIGFCQVSVEITGAQAENAGNKGFPERGF